MAAINMAIKYGGHAHLPVSKDVMAPKRLTKEETLELINRIPVLQHLFKHRRDVNDEESDSAEGVAYLSRFHKESAVADVTKSNKKSSVEDAEELSSDDEVDEQKESVVTMSAQSKAEKRRLAMSLATLASKRPKCAKLVREGAIPTLISLAQIDDKAIQWSFSTAMCLLSTEPSIRAQMIEEGACAALINLAQHSQNHEVVKDCIMALCNLSCEVGHEHRVVKDGIGFAIIHTISSVPDVVDICLRTLLNLSCVTDKYSRIEDVTDTLMHINAYSLTLDQEILVASAMCNLSALKNFQLRLVEDGCIRFVERGMKSPFKELRLLASRIVDNLTTESKTRVKLVDNGIIQVVMVMSKDEVEDVRLCAVKAIFNLARDINCREKIVNANAISVIIKISTEKFENMVLGRTSSRILRIICGDERLANKLVRDGIIRALMALLRTEDAIIQQYCAESICSLFQTEEVMGKLVEQGAVGILVSLAHSATELITSEWCSFALYHLATSRLCPESMLGAAILPCIVKLSDINDERTKYFCSATLQHITSVATVDSSSAIYILVHMLRNDKENANTKAHCAAALYNLSASADNCSIMLEAGVLSPVVKLTSSAHTGTKSKCAAILSRLSLHQNYYAHFAAGDVLRVLLDLSCVDNIITQRKVIIALSNLSQSQVLREQLLALKPIPFIMSLASKCDENVRRGCASIVCNLAYEVGSEKSMVQQQPANVGGHSIVTTLLITAMITSDNLHSKVICVKALINLMADKSLHKGMVNDGLIWGLSSLFSLPDQEMKLLCMKALCCLSSESFITEMLQSALCMQSITQAVAQRDDLELLRIGARTLNNILRQTKDSDEKFRRKVVESIVPMAECPDIEISEICILCLCLTSQSESCREGIVESGMLQMIDASSIFFKPRVSTAYLTMFENIANNPKMRTKVLDDKCISRFMQIVSLKDAKLDVAVASAIYCLSCCQENIPILVDQDILTLIEQILDLPNEQDNLVTSLLVSCLHNLCTNTESQAKLVSRGVMNMLYQLWELAREDFTKCNLCILAVAYLGCGNVNTVTLVKQECSDILTFVVRAKKFSGYAMYNFDLDVIERVAIALRNLLTVPSNHKAMIAGGVLPALVEMAKNSFTAIQLHAEYHQNHHGNRDRFIVAKRRTSFSSDSSGSVAAGKAFLGPEHHSIANNCAAGLRLLSYNELYRQALIDCDMALQVMLEGEASDMAINQGLLAELEIESWSNGSRGTSKVGKIFTKLPGKLSTELLGGTRKLKLTDVEIRTVELEKYHVRVEVEEPTSELSELLVEEGVLSIADLASYSESNHDYDNPRLMFCPKQECHVNLSDLTFLRHHGEAIDLEEELASAAATLDPSADNSALGANLSNGTTPSPTSTPAPTPAPSNSQVSSATTVVSPAVKGLVRRGSRENDLASDTSSDKGKKRINFEINTAAGGSRAGSPSPGAASSSSASTSSLSLPKIPGAQGSNGNHGPSNRRSPSPTAAGNAAIGVTMPPIPPAGGSITSSVGSPTGSKLDKSRRSGGNVSDLDSLPSLSTSLGSNSASWVSRSTAGRSQKSKKRIDQGENEFRSLLASIRQSKKTGGATIEEVISKWHSQSRF